MPKTIVGIDISASSIRAVELVDISKPRPTLVRHHQIQLPQGAVSRGEVIEPRTVATALKQLWSAGGFKAKDVVLGVGNSRVLARDLTVPKMSITQIRESLPFQVQEMLPFPAENALLDFYPISEGMGETGPVINGLLVAAVKEAVLSNVTAAQLAGLNPIDVDLLPFALVRVLLRGAQSPGTTAIIDIGGSTTTVVVATNAVPQFVRIIPTGGDDLTLALATKLGISPEHAEHLKRTMGLRAPIASAEDQAVVGTIHEVASELITSLRNTLSYFAGSRQTDMVSRVILTGGGAALSGFREALSDFTRLPVTLGDPFEAVGVSRRLDGESVRASGGSLAVAIGLAMGSAA
jgi:type IV pilus assembly protein PilM